MKLIKLKLKIINMKFYKSVMGDEVNKIKIKIKNI
jgi:hypothetical protein